MKNILIFFIFCLSNSSISFFANSQVYTADANTVILDHFEGSSGASILAYSNTGACGPAYPATGAVYAYGPGACGLSQALTLSAPVSVPAGSSTYLKYPTGNILSMNNGTIEFWVYISSYSTGYAFVDQGPYYGSCAGWTFGMGTNASGQLSAGAWATFNMNSGSNVVPLNTWTHVAATWGSTGAKLYINGIQVGSDANTGKPASGFGGYLLMRMGTHTGLSLKMDELRVSNIQRTTFSTVLTGSPPTITGTTPVSRCDAGTVTLSATASAGTLNWYAASTGGISLGTGTSFTTPSISTTTIYYVDATNTGCTSARTAVIATVKTTSTSTTNTSICPNQLPYVWNGLTFTAAGSQTKTLVNSQGCDSLATLNLTVKTTSTSTTNTSICPSALPYVWNGLTFTAAGSQTKTLVNSVGCDSLATLNLTVKTTSTSTTNTSICPNQLPYVWNGLTFNAAGSQTKTLVNSVGCDSLVIYNLKLLNQPSITIKDTFYVLPNTSITLENEIRNSVSYKWQPNIFLNNDTIATPICTPHFSLNYTIHLNSLDNCTISRNVYVKLFENIIIPNIFSPNQDGINDFWEIKNLNLYNGVSVIIYDRGGKLIFNSIGYNKPWDGTFNNKPVQTSTYFYIIKILNYKTYSGSVIVIR